MKGDSMLRIILKKKKQENTLFVNFVRPKRFLDLKAKYADRRTESVEELYPVADPEIFVSGCSLTA